MYNPETPFAIASSAEVRKFIRDARIVGLRTDGAALQRLAMATKVTLPDEPCVFLLAEGEAPRQADFKHTSNDRVPDHNANDIVVDNLRYRSFSTERYITTGIAHALLKRKHDRQARHGLRIGAAIAGAGATLAGGDYVLHDTLVVAAGAAMLCAGLGLAAVTHWRSEQPPSCRVEGFAPPIRFIYEGGEDVPPPFSWLRDAAPA